MTIKCINCGVAVDSHAKAYISIPVNNQATGTTTSCWHCGAGNACFQDI